MTALRALHATRNAAGLAEDDARDVYERVVGKRSTRAMSEVEHKRCIQELKRLYPAADRRRSSGARKRLEGPFAKKCQALWIAAWNLGLVTNPVDEALIAFVKRQTGLDHMNWLRDPADAEKAIEALKLWMAREVGVAWNWERGTPVWAKSPGFQIALAQWKLLDQDDTHRPDFWLMVFRIVNSPMHRNSPEMMRGRDWITVMSALGKRIRAGK